jgi:hypothetical protein
MSHHERTLLHRTRRAQGHSWHCHHSAPSYNIKRHQDPPLV